MYFTIQSIHHSTVLGSLILARTGNLASAGNLACAGKLFRAGRTFRATPSRLRESPRIALSGSGKPRTRPPLVFPVPWPTTRPLSYPERAGIPNYKEGLSLLPRVIRRHQHLPLGRQPRSPECSTHSSGLGRPPSRTLLIRNESCRTDPLLSELSTTHYSHVNLTDLYTL